MVTARPASLKSPQTPPRGGGAGGEGEMVGAGAGSSSTGPWAVDGTYRSVPANVAVYPPARIGTTAVRGDALVHDARPSAFVTAEQSGVPSEALNVMVWPAKGEPLLVSVAPTADRLTAVDRVALSAVSSVGAGVIVPSVMTRIQSPGCVTDIPTVMALPLMV